MSASPQQRHDISDADETDDEMPSLQPISDSSESEDDQDPQRRPTIGQRTALSRPVGGYPLYPDDTDVDVSENGTVIQSLDPLSPDVRFAREPRQQSQQHEGRSSSSPSRPAGDDIHPDSLSLIILYDREERRGQDERGTNEIPPERPQFNLSIGIQALYPFITREARTRDYDKPDRLRAHVVIDGLEPVSKDLLSRYEVIRGEDHSERTMCAVCYEQLDLDSPYDAGDCNHSDPILTENERLLRDLPHYVPFPKMVAFPCLHLFHSECLFPWLARRTTCPTCRSDVDPDSLTLTSNGGDARRPWVPPAKGVLEAWVQVEEKKRSSCPRPDNSVSLESRAPFPEPHIIPRGLCDKPDESTSSVGISLTPHDDDHLIS